MTQVPLSPRLSEIDPIPVGSPRGGQEPELEKLSDILDEWNSINWINKEKAKQQLEELPAKLQADEAFINAAKNSNKETAMQQGASSIMGIVIQMLSENSEFCRNYLDNPDFMNFINQRVIDSVYKQLGKEVKPTNVTIENHYHNTVGSVLNIEKGTE